MPEVLLCSNKLCAAQETQFFILPESSQVLSYVKLELCPLYSWGGNFADKLYLIHTNNKDPIISILLTSRQKNNLKKLEIHTGALPRVKP